MGIRYILYLNFSEREKPRSDNWEFHSVFTIFLALSCNQRFSLKDSSQVLIYKLGYSSTILL